MTVIKNINGALADNCNCGNWLKHWNNFNDKPAVFCSEIMCTQMFNLKGTHVQKITNEHNWFIVPLCEKHRSVKHELTINDFIQLVPANAADTCG